MIPTGVKEFHGKKEYYSTGSISKNGYLSEGIYTYESKPSRANRIAILNTVIDAKMMNTSKATIIDENLIWELMKSLG